MFDSILVTGGLGFIGSHLIEHLLETTHVKVVNLDAQTYAANQEWAAQFTHERYERVKGDIRDKDFVQRLFEKHQFAQVYHLAAESHVDNSITTPEIFVETNVNGTFHLLHTAYQLWMEQANVLRPAFAKAKFVHVSTDEVYGSLGDTGFFTETTPYAPSSPYSASKAASDHLAMSYYHTYGFPVSISNCSNNYGPRQHDEKLIPVVIRKALKQEPIPIYGTGTNVRDWLYVKDHCEALSLVMKAGQIGESYNIGGNNEIQNVEIAQQICKLLDIKQPRKDGKSYQEQITFVTDRLGHDYRYAIDSSKIQSELNWKPAETFSTGIEKTVNWYLNKYK